ncbi:hypothetical protein U1Q18_052117 [Sarracenia purpurea var. burkii]
MNDVVGSVREREGVSISFDSARLTLEQSRLHIGRAKRLYLRCSKVRRSLRSRRESSFLPLCRPQLGGGACERRAVCRSTADAPVPQRGGGDASRAAARRLPRPGFAHVAFAEGKFEEAIHLADASRLSSRRSRFPAKPFNPVRYRPSRSRKWARGRMKSNEIREQARAAADLELEWEAAIRLAGLRKHPGTLDSVQGRLLASGHLRLSVEFWRAKAKLAPFATRTQMASREPPHRRRPGPVLASGVEGHFRSELWGKRSHGDGAGNLAGTDPRRASPRTRILGGFHAVFPRPRTRQFRS